MRIYTSLIRPQEQLLHAEIWTVANTDPCSVHFVSRLEGLHCIEGDLFLL